MLFFLVFHWCVELMLQNILFCGRQYFVNVDDSVTEKVMVLILIEIIFLMKAENYFPDHFVLMFFPNSSTCACDCRLL